MTNAPFEHALIGEIIPFIDANFRTLADQPHRALPGLSMGGAYTHWIALAHLDKFADIGMFSGGSIAVSEIEDMAAPRKPGEPPATALDGDIPKGYPPAFLLSGTRDMCLSQTVLLHRKLRNAGVEADLNVFEGMWHFFREDPSLPESREAMAALANFFNRHLR